MKTSKISYLRAHLSEVLACVREGETVLVLDRDKPVARLTPYATEEAALTERMRELQQLGMIVHRPAAKPAVLPKPIKLDQPVDVARMVREDRERP